MAGSGRGDDLDQTVRRADPARWLSSRFVADRRSRAGLVAIYAFDHELDRATRVASSPLMAEIRLAWWREGLDEIFAGHAVRAHPATRALAETVARHDLARRPLEAMIDARIAILNEVQLDWARAEAWAHGVGASAAMLAARILDPATADEAAAPAGRAWGLFRLSRTAEIADPDVGARLGEALAAARLYAAALSPAAFPAVAHATLIRARPRSDLGGGLEARTRLMQAVLTGRL